MKKFNSNHWALILGGSSGFGLATAKKLAAEGMNIFVVHRDRRGSMELINKEFDQIRQSGVQFHSLNVSALEPSGREEILKSLTEKMGEVGKVRLLLHSIAFGNLKLIAPIKNDSARDISLSKLAEELSIDKEKIGEAAKKLLSSGCDSLHSLTSANYSETLLNEEDVAQTIYSMGTSILFWTQDLFNKKLFADDARVIGLTSEGNQVAWRGYAAVAAAKVALESISRSMALEFAPFGIRSNIVQPGVTSTKALAAIPGHEQMEAVARLRNPFKRTTTPEDVANVIALLATDEAAWINGSLIHVDGGEHIASL